MEAPTAEELAIQMARTTDDARSIQFAASVAKRLAEIHLNLALEKIMGNVKTKTDVAIFVEGTYRIEVVDKDSIIGAYPLENIK
jgi:hypothetical protein